MSRSPATEVADVDELSPDDERAVEAPSTPPEGAAGAGPIAPASGRAWLPWSLVGLLAATTLVFLGLWASAGEGEAGDVRAAAVAFMSELTTWDASEGLEGTTEALRSMGTGSFLDEVDEVLGSDVRATAEALGAVSAGEVTEVVLDPDPDRAAWTAIVFVEQSLTVAGITQAQEQIARLVLVQVEGEWRVEVLELLNAPTPLDATAPGGGDQ